MPDFARRKVVYSCPFCGKEWTRSVEDELDVHDVVRVDLDDGYLYGGVQDIDGDRVLVGGFDHTSAPVQEEDLWVDLWRVIIY